MLSITRERRIWLCIHPTDMRRSFDGLSTMVRSHLGDDPTNGSWFVFINRRRTQIRVLAFEDGGYCLWSKRLEQGHFAALNCVGDNKRALSCVEFMALIEGVDMVIKRRRKRYRKAA